MSIPSTPPPSYDDVIEMDMIERCNNIWSKFDEVMERELGDDMDRMSEEDWIYAGEVLKEELKISRRRIKKIRGC